MGSLMEACCTGFICRLCSKMNHKVIFIYGADGLENNLLEKINSYLPIEISEEDELPKTICEACMVKILVHHRLIVQIRTAQKRFVKMREEELAARNATTADSNASSRTLSAESTASSRTMSVDSTDAVEEPAETLQSSEINTETTDAPADTVNTRVQIDQPNELPTSQDPPQNVSEDLNPTDPAGEPNGNGEQAESGPSTANPTNRLKRKQRNPTRSDKEAKKRLE
ncbi:uncharacterized protein LOC128723368 [Anopheles nili]|uniref:uncharacterized protein LOC128723368 n=1 Tax=Anopheles nili TaxID=185578 RepID=UPI00237BC208|nr:uncharacterized protein LOC128723368 [Anopheles nili]